MTLCIKLLRATMFGFHCIITTNHPSRNKLKHTRAVHTMETTMPLLVILEHGEVPPYTYLLSILIDLEI